MILTDGRKTKMTKLGVLLLLLVGLPQVISIYPSGACKELLDIVVVVDGSDSISESNFLTVKESLSQLITDLSISDGGINLGLILYSSNITTTIPLTSDPELLLQQVDALRHARDGTNTALALEELMRMIEGEGRPGVTKVGLVITDGLSKDVNATLEQAELLKAANVTMFTVGISPKVNSAELLGIASKPSNYLIGSGFDELKYLLQKVVSKTCSQCYDYMEVMAVLDGSDSITSEEFEHLKMALMNLVEEVKLGEDATRFGVVLYSSNITSIIDLSYNKTYLLEEIALLQHPRDGTETALALAEVYDIFKNQTRPGYHMVGIIVTDGISKDTNATLYEADRLRTDLGVSMFSVGMRNESEWYELQGIASNETMVVSVEDYDNLDYTLANIVLGFCPASCPVDLDVLVVVDGSDSISSSDFESLKRSLIKLIVDFDIGSPTSEARFGLILYSSNISAIIEFSNNKTQLVQDILSLDHPQDGTRTALAVKEMIDMFTRQSRSIVRRVGIVITDGRSKNPELTGLYADEARNNSIIMYAVGVAKYDSSELLAIADSEDLLFTIDTFYQLGGSLMAIVHMECGNGTGGNQDDNQSLTTSSGDEDYTTTTTVGPPHDFITTTVPPTGCPGGSGGGNTDNSVTTTVVTRSSPRITPGFPDSTTGVTSPPSQNTPPSATPPSATPPSATPLTNPTPFSPQYSTTNIQTSSPPPSSNVPNTGPPSPPTSSNTGPPSSSPSSNTGPPSPPPSSNTGPPSPPPSSNTGPPSPPPSSNTGPPSPPPSSNTGPPSSPPSSNTGPPSSSTSTSVPNTGPPSYTPTPTPTPSHGGVSSTPANGPPSPPPPPRTTTVGGPVIYPQPTPTPVIKNVCDDCVIVHGIGYIGHPDNCNQFYQCYYSSNNILTAALQDCGQGLHWDQDLLVCSYPKPGGCKKDPCYNKPNGSTMPGLNCRHYYLCNDRTAFKTCCPPGSGYDVSANRCVRSQCSVPCFSIQTVQECNKRAVVGIPTMFEEKIGSGSGASWTRRDCAAGTEFDPNDCECSRFVLEKTTVRNPMVSHPSVCKPILHLSFDMDTKDKSGNHIFVHNDGVTASDGLAYFSGNNSGLIIPRFSNVDFGFNVLIIRIRYKPDGPVTGLQSLVTNADCGATGPIRVLTDADKTVFSMNNGTNKEFTIPYSQSRTSDGWFNVTYTIKDGFVSGEVNNVNNSNNPISGGVPRSQYALQIGRGDIFDFFKGWMDYVYVYIC